MNTDHLLNLLFVGSLVAGSLCGLFALACLPLGTFRAIRKHDRKLLRLAGTFFGIMLFFAVICGVLYFTAVNAAKPL